MKTLTVEDIREPLFVLLPPIFRECVGESLRYSLEAPFAWDGWACATDGRIFVRTKLTPGVAAILALEPDRKLVDPAPVFLWTHRDTPVAMPAIPEKTVCYGCQGARVETCDLCDQSHTCEICEGSGLAWTFKARVPLSPLTAIGPDYATILAKHGATLYLPNEEPGKPIRFVAEDCDGLVMPLVVEAPCASV